MGLNLTVGIVAGTIRYTPERLNYHYEQFAAINTVLVESGQPEHVEPEDIESWSMELHGHGGLQTLRRIAAHLWAHQSVPEPAKRGAAGVPETGSDTLINAYFEVVQRWLRGGETRYPMAYEHLILHSDDRGYYLPIRFADVIFTPPSLNIAGSMFGSAPVLADECRQLLGALQALPDLQPDGDEVREAIINPGRGEGWQRYGAEVEACLKLIAACQRSVETGAALVFVGN